MIRRNNRRKDQSERTNEKLGPNENPTQPLQQLVRNYFSKALSILLNCCRYQPHTLRVKLNRRQQSLQTIKVIGRVSMYNPDRSVRRPSVLCVTPTWGMVWQQSKNLEIVANAGAPHQCVMVVPRTLPLLRRAVHRRIQKRTSNAGLIRPVRLSAIIRAHQ